jgi:hypothetical protein
LPHYSHIVAICEVVGYLAVDDAVHVDVLNFEGAPGRLYSNQHSAIDRKVRRASVGAGVSATDYDPAALGDRIQRRQS